MSDVDTKCVPMYPTCGMTSRNNVRATSMFSSSMKVFCTMRMLLRGRTIINEFYLEVLKRLYEKKTAPFLGERQLAYSSR